MPIDPDEDRQRFIAEPLEEPFPWARVYFDPFLFRLDADPAPVLTDPE